MTLEHFGDEYFSFLLSGRAEDFATASDTFREALSIGCSLQDLQTRMDDSHTSAELLCLLIDNGVVKQQG
jgi:hypothetical protein